MDVIVRGFVDADAAAFKQLNEAWIQRYFELESQDREILDDPWTHVLQPGGAIFMATRGARAVGTAAMLVIPNEPAFELAKMTVAEDARGLGVGYRLGQAVLNEARRRGGQRVTLETNTRLEPAISLYRKLGFSEVEMCPSPYARCNLKMEIHLQAEREG
ncbi:MAG: GNAT family N-acetyltransferase [Myxococcota bacterium]